MIGLSDEINEKIKKDFVFVSYAHGVSDDYVHTLVARLRDEGVNVIYDEGGLPPGVDLQEFQLLILNHKCKKVLIIFDKIYFEKVGKQEGNVSVEYSYIRGNLSRNPTKYVPIVADESKNICDPFQTKIYIKISDFDDILDVCKASKSKLVKPEVFKEKLDEINRLYEEENYSAAFEICNKLMTSRLSDEISSEELASFYSHSICIKLINYSTMNDPIFDTSLKGLVSLLDTDGESIEKYSRYAYNCGLYYSKLNDMDAAHKYSYSAYENAQNCNCSFYYYYGILLAHVLYKTKKYSEADDLLEEAEKLFKKDDKKELKKEFRNNGSIVDDIEKDIYVYKSLVSLRLGKQKKKKTEKYSYYDTAKEYMYKIVDLEKREGWNDEARVELLETISEVINGIKEMYV